MGRKLPAPVLRLGMLCMLSALSLTSQPLQTDIHVKRIVGIDYPWFARLGGIQGNVEVAVTISGDGAVHKIRVVSGPEPLVRAVRESVSKWLFSGCSPAPGNCEAKILFSFALNGVCDAGQECVTRFEFDLPDKVRVYAKRAHAIID